jgi:hypothetical protein
LPEHLVEAATLGRRRWLWRRRHRSLSLNYT